MKSVRSLSREMLPPPAWRPVPVISGERASKAFELWGAPGVVHCYPKRRCYVYFALAPRVCIKVGWSRNPVTRLKTVHREYHIPQRFGPLVLIDGCCSEQEILSALHADRMPNPSGYRELFSLSARMLELVALLRAGAESCYFHNPSALEPSPIRHCSLCGQTGHDFSRCDRAEAA